MNLLVTMNVGGYMPDNVRRSHVAAAEGWGCDYLECVTSRGGSVFRAKHAICAELHADRVIWLDADAVVRDDCPIWHEGDAFLAVPGVIGEASEANARGYWEKLSGIFQRSTPFDPATYINAGVFAFTPAKHRGVFERIVQWMDAIKIVDDTGVDVSNRLNGPNYAMVEQTIVNLVMAESDITVGLLPFDFNRTDGKSGYIMHLAGSDRRGCASKRAALEAIEWRTHEAVA